jgi:thymidylate synthase
MKFLFLLFLMASQVFIKIESGEDVYIVNSYEQCENSAKDRKAYGWCVYSKENGNQYEHCLHELIANKDSRRAVMIYNRPEMWNEYNKNGMNEFMCTNVVQYFIREHELIANVQMRSNDVIFGYNNDYAWQKYVLDSLYDDLSYNYSLRNKKIIWNAGSLHLYDRHYKLVDEFLESKDKVRYYDTK